MNKKPEQPFGVYGNLCVVYFRTHHPYLGPRPFGIVPHSLEVPGVASDGDLRKFPEFTLWPYVIELADYLLLTVLSSYTHSWSHLLGSLTSPFQRMGEK